MLRRARRSFPLVLSCVLPWLAISCGTPDVPREERRHESLGAFVEGREPEPSRRVVLIGIDGASWEYLRPLFAEGELPALARLAEEGATGTLRSIECHFTPPAWTTMLTGRMPHEHGVYSFGSWIEDEQRFAKVSSNGVQVPAVWDVAGAADRRVSVIGVPTTWPPHPVNGVLVAGLMTPKTRLPPLSLSVAPERRQPPAPSLTSYGPVITGALEDEHNVLLPTFLDGVDDGEPGYDRLHLRVLRKGFGPPKERELGTYEFAVGEFSPWVRVRLGPGPTGPEGFTKLRFDPPSARGLHYLLTPTFVRAERPFTYPEALAGELYERFGYYLPHEFLSGEVLPSIAREAADHARWFFARDDWDLFLYVFGQSDNAHHLKGFGEEVLPVYRTIDAFLGEVMDALDENTTLVIASDHGFGAFDHAVDLNQFLAEQGLLHWKTQGVIDHDRSLVFHNMWHLHFNHALLDAETLATRGVPVAEGQAPADALAEHLIRSARELAAPDGQAFPVELYRLPEDAVGNAPDLAVRAHADFWVEFWNVESPSAHVVRPLVGDERWKHARDGVLAVYGAGVREGAELGVVDIQDVAPTLLDLMGLPVADDLAGRAVPDLLAPARARSQPLHRVASYEGEVQRASAPEAEDTASFEETLRALGYVRD